MKLRYFCFLGLLTIFTAQEAYAGPCETLLCMAGKLQGQSGGAECSAPVSDYFSILRFGRRGRFDPGATAAARLGFLNSCPAPGIGSWPSQINAVFGTSFGG